jgi:hypothetical protein
MYFRLMGDLSSNCAFYFLFKFCEIQKKKKKPLCSKRKQKKNILIFFSFVLFIKVKELLIRKLSDVAQF